MLRLIAAVAMPTMTITTISSISEKPLSRLRTFMAAMLGSACDARMKALTRNANAPVIDTTLPSPPRKLP